MILQSYEWSVKLSDDKDTTVLCYEKPSTPENIHPLVFCQGATCFVDELTKEFVQDILLRTTVTHIIVYNYRGLNSGFTGVSKINQYSTKLLANDLNRIIEFCEANLWKRFTKVSLAGYSFGGVIMQEYLRYFGVKKVRTIAYVLSLCFRCCRLSYRKLIDYAFRYQKYVQTEDKKHENFTYENQEKSKEYWERKDIKKKLLVYQSLAMILDRIFDRDSCVFSQQNFKIPILMITAKNDEIFNFDKNKDCLSNHYPPELLRHVHLTDCQHNVFWKDPVFISNYFVDFYKEFSE